MSDIKANREYKDRLFWFIFGNPEKKEWTLTAAHLRGYDLRQLHRDM